MLFGVGVLLYFVSHILLDYNGLTTLVREERAPRGFGELGRRAFYFQGAG